MRVTRREFSFGAIALALAGCGGSPAPSTGRAGLDPAFVPQPNPSYDAWVAAFKTRARARGISDAVLTAGFRGQGYLPGVIERDRNQTEFKRSLEDYLAIVAPEDKIAFGRKAYARQKSSLSRVSARYGVAPDILAAIWGVESYFGTKRGTIPVISATSTLAWEGRRGKFFESNLMDALRILQSGDARPDQLVGSWAGAMGHTQMIPNAYQANAVDFDGNGKRDIWSDNPIDAFATTGRFLQRAGWRKGGLWGLEVKLPTGFDAPVGRGRRRSVGAWQSVGVRPARGGSLPDHGNGAILAPMGRDKPAFLVFHNFDMLLRYNPSENYGLGVGYLAHRLSGGGPLATPFGRDRNGLTLDDRKALQSGLSRAGFNAGRPDGVIGNKTKAAIRGFEKANGLPVTGTPSPALLAMVR